MAILNIRCTFQKCKKNISIRLSIKYYILYKILITTNFSTPLNIEAKNIEKNFFFLLTILVLPFKRWQTLPFLSTISLPIHSLSSSNILLRSWSHRSSTRKLNQACKSSPSPPGLFSSHLKAASSFTNSNINFINIS